MKAIPLRELRKQLRRYIHLGSEEIVLITNEKYDVIAQIDKIDEDIRLGERNVRSVPGKELAKRLSDHLNYAQNGGVVLVTDKDGDVVGQISPPPNGEDDTESDEEKW